MLIKYIILIILCLFTLIISRSLPVVIYFPNRLIEISSPIIIADSNVTMIGGNKTVLKLKDKSDCPVIIIGDGNTHIRNIKISNLTINGNRKNQNRELWQINDNGLINNNGITIQNAENITINDIVIENCKSGGLITTLNVSFLTVSNLISRNNEFDGVACYSTTKSCFINSIFYNNLAAGISLDDSFNFNVFSNCVVFSNNTAIFMRNSSYNKFFNMTMRGNTHGIFIAQVNENTNTGCIGNLFSVRLDKTNTIKIHDKSCVGNEIKID